MTITGFDHIVLSCGDVSRTVAFYRDHLGLDACEERPGKWALFFGEAKISLQDEAAKPELAAATLPGTGNFCLVSDASVESLRDRLEAAGIPILDGPGWKQGAVGRIWSIYFRDPDGNLVEVANRR